MDMIQTGLQKLTRRPTHAKVLRAQDFKQKKTRALELSDEETGGGRALSCVPLLISTWPRQAEEGEGTLIRLQPLQHTSHGFNLEIMFRSR
ncbi:uncharacterized protein LOC118893890 isoform X3 [Balaenoptera musculus]|uniref:Uncharacterized protein LOC118893890 isoform X3 n=1 Tax=Balaenoptera musculus TaxID=9771 RepID=A0A8B8X703_BALMU|nr:uncharacterized protein LOC118893890 isoform X3 [Balaenoptera musculus]